MGCILWKQLYLNISIYALPFSKENLFRTYPYLASLFRCYRHHDYTIPTASIAEETTRGLDQGDRARWNDVRFQSLRAVTGQPHRGTSNPQASQFLLLHSNVKAAQ
jgi:hypothetical protein